MTRSYMYNVRPGRRKTKINPKPPKDFSLHLGLMKKLDIRGWYKELGERQQYEKMGCDPRDYTVDPRLRRVTDPIEIDRFMCRTNVVVECKNAKDLEIAHVNSRIVVELDPHCPNERLFEKMKAVLDNARRHRPRKINTRAWAEHRILALYDLKLLGYDLSTERKQLSLWLFPEIEDEKARGDKYDRARDLLEAALASLDSLRAQSGA